MEHGGHSRIENGGDGNNFLSDPLLDDQNSKKSLNGGDFVNPVIKVSIKASIFNLGNTTLGAGIVSIPFVFAQCGLLLACAIMVLFALLSAYASWLLFKASEATGSWSFMSLARSTYGEGGVISVQVVILCLTIGVLSAMFVQLGETGSDVLQTLVDEDYSWWRFDQIAVKAILAVCPLAIPFALTRSLAALASISLFVLVAIVYLVLVVCAIDSNGDDADDTDDALQMVTFGPSFFSAVSIAVLAFGNQLNVQQVVTEMAQPTPPRVKQLVISCNAVVATLYFAIGIAGYARFRGNTMDNIMSNYTSLAGVDFAVFSIARIGVVAIVVCSYPMLLFPSRSCFHSVVIGLQAALKGASSSSPTDAPIDNTSPPPPPAWLHITEGVGIVAFTFFISVVAPSIGTIMGLTGAIAGNLLGFVLPGIFFMKACPESPKAMPMALTVLGSVFGVVCVVAQIIELA